MVSKSRYHLPGMDCPTEEQLVRMGLAGIPGIHRLSFDLTRREVTIFHGAGAAGIEGALKELGLGCRHLETTRGEDAGEPQAVAPDRNILLAAFAINGGFFAVELVAGWIGHSMGLMADSLDMLADAVVYGLALFAAGAGIAVERRVALVAGVLQLSLAALGMAEVVRRFLGAETLPDWGLMAGMGALALAANTLTLFLLGRTKGQGLHLEASRIFTSSDILANVGVILAAIFVTVFKSGIPDLVIGVLAFTLVTRGAVQILKLGLRRD